jgi:hypothetical protein
MMSRRFKWSIAATAASGFALSCGGAGTDGIAVAIGRSAADSFAAEAVPLTSDAQAWLDVLRSALPAIADRAAELAVPFGIPAFDATIVAGNRGFSDGFAWVPTHIGINVQEFADVYGPPNEEAQARMTRIVAHEYLHLLTYAYYPNHPELRDTPFARALWTMFHEGIGDYVSVSSRWLPEEDGTYSEMTARTLERLEPIFVERPEALATATPATEGQLRSGIAMGKFDEKWGSLPIALWLHTEAALCGEPNVLDAIMRLGPTAVLPLARHYVAPELRARLDDLLVMSDQALPDGTPGPCALVAFD